MNTFLVNLRAEKFTRTTCIYGCEMLKLAVKYAFEIAKADAVQLNVFEENPGAKKCYEKVGYKERAFTEGAFPYKEEAWGRCNMVIKR